MVVHANWAGGMLHVWAEVEPRRNERAAVSAGAPAAAAADEGAEEQPSHPFAAPHEAVEAALAGYIGEAAANEVGGERAELALRLPWRGAMPVPSPTIAHAAGLMTERRGGESARLVTVRVPTIRVSPAHAARVLEAMDAGGIGELNGGGARRCPVGPSVRFFAAAGRLVRHLLAQQRFVPSLLQDAAAQTKGVWQAWLADGPTAERVGLLMGAMPASARAAVEGNGNGGNGGAGAAGGDGWGVLHDFVLRVGDAECRRVLVGEQMVEAIEGRDASADAHAAWLSGLLGAGDQIPGGMAARADMARRVHRWIGALEDRGVSSKWRLLLRLVEPVDLAGLGELQAPGEEVRWTLLLGLQSAQAPSVTIDAADLWLLPPGAVTVGGERIESPHDVLLGEMGRAARLYKKLETALEGAQPTQLELTTSEAYRFLREISPILREQGVGVVTPAWWEQPTIRLGARLRVESEDVNFEDEFEGGASPAAAAGARLGLGSLVNYRWQLTIGDVALTLEQFQKLAAQHAPLVRMGGRWVEVRPDDVRSAMDFLTKNPGGTMAVSQLLKLAYGSDPRQTGLPILGMEATGWVAKIFGTEGSSESMPMLRTPSTFVGALRPYQVKGLSWLAFLDRFGLGACLADDMGLGKTIQLLALLANERERARRGNGQAGREESEQRGETEVGAGGENGATGDESVSNARPPTAADGGVGPTLLVVPMSVVGNWVHETRRFTPNLRVLVHHGLDRLQGPALASAAREADLVITTYALAHRDRETLALIDWNRVALDEAQNIKNPSAKQTQAIRAIPAGRRVALTGTPVENRLGELWSIMDFLNPGYLGSAHEFRTRFAVPVERYHDPRRSEQLRGLVRPFILRRLKSDSSVIADLPEKIETREFCFLTPEQATLYRTCVSDMLSAAEASEGIQRRGVVLAGLIKLKQICNHPAQFYKETIGGGEGDGHAPVRADRSGKCLRLVEMLQEVTASGDRALVFTQFRQMGAILAAMLRHELDREVLFLHGGTTAEKRQEMIERFQSGDPACPVFILSLKAGGLGLNLTAANHVFHFDRWWNPAVEAQATDRAYRIGQTRSVQVHKFVVSGTLEERIDQMIEEKTALADLIIGAGERWLTELSTSQLRDLLTLRPEAVGDESAVGAGAEDEA